MDTHDVSQHLILRISEIQQVSDLTISAATRFDELAMDSMTKVGLLAELEQLLGHRIDPDVLIDQATIGGLAKAVAK